MYRMVDMYVVVFFYGPCRRDFLWGRKNCFGGRRVRATSQRIGTLDDRMESGDLFVEMLAVPESSVTCLSTMRW